MTNKSEAYQLEFEPLLIRQILLDCDITQDEVARVIGISRPAMNLVINRGNLPKRSPKLREKIESYILNHKKTRTWLTDRGIGVKKIWEPTKEETRKVQPPGTFIRMQKTREQAAIVPGDPLKLTAGAACGLMEGKEMLASLFSVASLRHSK